MEDFATYGAGDVRGESPSLRSGVSAEIGLADQAFLTSLSRNAEPPADLPNVSIDEDDDTTDGEPFDPPHSPRADGDRRPNYTPIEAPELFKSLRELEELANKNTSQMRVAAETIAKEALK